MTSDVVLTSAMRTNLLSLQNTQSNIDKVQNALATGLKVSSALDNPQNFFASESLKNRAGDLSRLLDGMGQSIQTIKAAEKGTTGLTKLLDQAESLANEAATVTTGSSGASVTGNIDLRGVDDIVGDLAGIADNNYINFTVTDPDGSTPTATVAFDANYGEDGANGNRVILDQYETVEQVISQINNLRDTDGNQVLKAELNENGQLKVSTLNGGDLRMEFHDDGSSEANSVADALGFGNTNLYSRNYAGDDVVPEVAETRTAITAAASPSLNSYALLDTNTNEVASRTTLLNDVRHTAGGSAIVALFASDSQIQVSVNGGTRVNVAEAGANAATTTVQDFIDNINGDATLGSLIEAGFNDETGEITIKAISAEAKTIQIAAYDATNATGATTVNLGFGVRTDLSTDAADATGNTNERISESIAFGEGAGRLAQLEKDYGALLSQMNDLVGDSGYRGVNLLAADTMETFFNEDRTSKLQTVGQDLSTTGLGLKEANFVSAEQISASVTQVRAAKESVRNFGSALANSLTVIQTREDFTKGMVATLTEGSDKLTVADQNEEGAKLLALQTRQQLGVTSLSLASQAQQAVLRLF